MAQVKRKQQVALVTGAGTENTMGCIVNMLDQKVFNLTPDFLSYTRDVRFGVETG
ncbi:MAG TPA: hypothetical protein VJT81_03355 [Burkholderiales bacterium]|nr:hypothetical protein [Burkholderiales bacterium]